MSHSSSYFSDLSFESSRDMSTMMMASSMSSNVVYFSPNSSLNNSLSTVELDQLSLQMRMLSQKSIKKNKRKITLWIRSSMSIMDTKKKRVMNPTPIYHRF